MVEKKRNSYGSDLHSQIVLPKISGGKNNDWFSKTFP